MDYNTYGANASDFSKAVFIDAVFWGFATLAGMLIMAAPATMPVLAVAALSVGSGVIISLTQEQTKKYFLG